MVAKTQLTRGKKTRIMYIELRSGFGDCGPARIGRVSFSKTGASIYYGGKQFQRAKGGSGVKRDRSDRHWAGSGPVEVDDEVREEYEAFLRGTNSGAE